MLLDFWRNSNETNDTPIALHSAADGCGGNSADATYQQIDQETAKEMMDTQEVIILDVRERMNTTAVTSPALSCYR